MLKALRVLGVPVVFVVIMGMTYRYIFLLLEAARDMFESRRSRIMGKLKDAKAGVLQPRVREFLMSRTIQLSGEVYSAMVARGFRGEVYVLDEFQTSTSDWIMLAVFVVLASGGIYFGR